MGEFEAGALDSGRGAEVVAEFVAEIDREFVEAAFAFDEDVEMFIDYAPFLVVAGQDGVVVFKDAHHSLAFVEKSVLFVDEGEFPLGADGFGLFEFGCIDPAVRCGARAFHYVDAEVFAACHLHRARVAYCRVEVEVEGDFAAGVFPSSKCYFNCAHFLFCLREGW